MDLGNAHSEQQQQQQLPPASPQHQRPPPPPPPRSGRHLWGIARENVGERRCLAQQLLGAASDPLRKLEGKG